MYIFKYEKKNMYLIVDIYAVELVLFLLKKKFELKVTLSA